jgi:hypothetical protein
MPVTGKWKADKFDNEVERPEQEFDCRNRITF